MHIAMFFSVSSSANELSYCVAPRKPRPPFSAFLLRRRKSPPPLLRCFGRHGLNCVLLCVAGVLDSPPNQSARHLQKKPATTTTTRPATSATKPQRNKQTREKGEGTMGGGRTVTTKRRCCCCRCVCVCLETCLFRAKTDLLHSETLRRRARHARK